MKFDVILKEAYDKQADTKVVFCYEDQILSENTYDLEDEVKTMIGHLVRSEVIKGKSGEVQSFRMAKENYPNKIILAGLGKKEELGHEKIRKAIAKATKEANTIKAKSLEISPIEHDEISLYDSTRLISEISILASYRFDKYQSDKKTSTLEAIYILCGKEDKMEIMERAAQEGAVLGNSTIYARDLVNEPANALLPITLAEEAKKTGKDSGFDVEIYDENKIKELDMKAFLEVARASENPPRFIVMRYFGDEANKDKITGLVGKGLTYDSGGLSIKTKTGMINMKSDMGGSAAVIGAMSAIAKMNLKINVVAVIAACENMISGRSYRPGDIIGSMAGKTIYIGSTDAEGRLTLIDAVHYIIEKEKVERVVDIATLTGAAVAALGTTTTAVISNNDDFYSKLEEASKESGEKIWRMPTFDDYKELVKSKVADLTNSAGHPGTITAALFIGEFVQEKPWIHMDIAGTAWSGKSKEYISEGGTGAGVRNLYYLVKGLS